MIPKNEGKMIKNPQANKHLVYNWKMDCWEERYRNHVVQYSWFSEIGCWFRSEYWPTERSSVMEAVHECAKNLLDAGAISEITMREFDEICLPK